MRFFHMPRQVIPSDQLIAYATIVYIFRFIQTERILFKVQKFCWADRFYIWVVVLVYSYDIY